MSIRISNSTSRGLIDKTFIIQGCLFKDSLSFIVNWWKKLMKRWMSEKLSMEKRTILYYTKKYWKSFEPVDDFFSSYCVFLKGREMILRKFLCCLTVLTSRCSIGGYRLSIPNCAEFKTQVVSKSLWTIFLRNRLCVWLWSSEQFAGIFRRQLHVVPRKRKREDKLKKNGKKYL